MTMEQIQHLLAYLGYYRGDCDGVCGPLTREATRSFQNAFCGLDPDGIPGAQTQKALTNAVANGMPQRDDSETAGSFWDEIEYFDREEFRCKCAGRYCDGFPAEPREDMVRLANDARKHFGRAAKVVSGLRCREWNRLNGGVGTSQHQYGEACDIRISGVTADQLLAFFQGRAGVRYAYKINDTNVHFDVPMGSR